MRERDEQGICRRDAGRIEGCCSRASGSAVDHSVQFVIRTRAHAGAHADSIISESCSNTCTSLDVNARSCCMRRKKS